MKVFTAAASDFHNWMEFVRRIKPIFGLDLFADDTYRHAVQTSIASGLAFCVKKSDEIDGQILGGMLFSDSEKPVYKIAWFAVSESHMHQGIGTALFKHAESTIEKPAQLMVETFDNEHPDSTSARNFYKKMGMVEAEIITGDFPHGSKCQVFRKHYA